MKMWERSVEESQWTEGGAFDKLKNESNEEKIDFSSPQECFSLNHYENLIINLNTSCKGGGGSGSKGEDINMVKRK